MAISSCFLSVVNHVFVVLFLTAYTLGASGTTVDVVLPAATTVDIIDERKENARGGVVVAQLQCVPLQLPSNTRTDTTHSTQHTTTTHNTNTQNV
jgi:hypothetical protein